MAEAVPTTPSGVQNLPDLRVALGSLTFARVMLNGLRRFPYLVLTPMAAALGVPRSMLEQALAFQWVISMLSPATGPLIDAGRRRVMLVSMLMLAAGSGLAALVPGYGAVAFAILLGSAGKTLYDPSMQAYIGDKVPYARRAMALGVTELAWSGSLVTFGPLSAFLIERAGVQAIFAVLGIGALAGMVILAIYLPPDTPRPPHPDHAPRPSLITTARMILSNPGALTIIIAILLVAGAFDLFMIIYESWLIEAFGLSTIAIGTLSFVFAIAELGGELVIIGFADRFGKRRIAVVAPVVTTLAYLILPGTAGYLTPALIVLFLLFMAFEVSTISLVPLATEAFPQARGVMLTGFWTGISAGRLLGTTLGGPLYRSFGLGANMLLAAVMATTAALLILRFVPRDHRVRAGH